MEVRGENNTSFEKKNLLERGRRVTEFNPMLGLEDVGLE
ncbi:hypothetical protein CM15mP43_10420 [bacterium]|nr:MAG: hypothetical protein CM15mP43_10420 [bacterium]